MQNDFILSEICIMLLFKTLQQSIKILFVMKIFGGEELDYNILLLSIVGMQIILNFIFPNVVDCQSYASARCWSVGQQKEDSCSHFTSRGFDVNYCQ